MHDTYDKESFLKDMHNMLVKDIECLETKALKALMKRMSYMFKKFPFMLSIIIDTCLEAMFQRHFKQFCLE